MLEMAPVGGNRVFAVPSDMPISPELLRILVCPEDRAPVRLVAGGKGIECERCHRVYPIRDDIPVMLVEEATIAGASSRG